MLPAGARSPTAPILHAVMYKVYVTWEFQHKHPPNYRIWGLLDSYKTVCKRLSIYPVARVADVRGTESGDQRQHTTIVGVETAEEAHTSNEPFELLL